MTKQVRNYSAKRKQDVDVQPECIAATTWVSTSVTSNSGLARLNPRAWEFSLDFTSSFFSQEALIVTYMTLILWSGAR